MGLFDMFKKDGGKELFKENEAAEAKAEAIRREIKRLGLPGDLQVRVEGDKVKISGQVPDQETKEKLMLIVGNTKHVGAVDEDLQPRQSASAQAQKAGQTQQAGGQAQQKASRFYTVERGDTLSKIAQRFYGDAQRYNVIFSANQPMLDDPDEIYPGQVLRIPDVGQAAA